jgi:transposase
MRQITEVLRLAAQGLSCRQIGQSVGISPSTVQGYLKRAQAAGVSWPLPDDVDAVVLEERLFKREVDAYRPGRPEPDWLDVHRERKQGKHVTLQLLWLEYRQVHADGWGYTQFCAHYHRWLERQDVVMRLEYPAGERMFVDFCGDTLPITDAETGEIWQAQVFVATLAASGYMYVEATGTQELAAWLSAHVNALEFYGAAPRLVVPDNLKSGVTRACWYDPELNPTYLELARHFALAILPTRPDHPRDKAAVEAAVQVAERWVLAPLRKRRFFSLGEANAAIAEQLRIVNQRRFRGQDLSRRTLFEQLERPALRPLPQMRYEFAIWKPAKVNIDYHIEFAERYYSVPHQLVREAVEVRATARVVEVFHRGRRVTSHAREYGRRRFITKPEHMPAAHRAHLEWTPSKLVTWGTSIGPPVAELIEMILRTRPHPEHGYRACLGLMRLVRRYGGDRVSAACKRALATGSISYGSVDAILKNGLDRVPVVVEASPKVVPIQHANLRGSSYYQQLLIEA